MAGNLTKWSTVRPHKIERASVDWVRARGNTMEVHMADGDLEFARITLKSAVEKWGLTRIHRSVAVHPRAVELVDTCYFKPRVLMKDGTVLSVSRRTAIEMRALERQVEDGEVDD